MRAFAGYSCGRFFALSGAYGSECSTLAATKNTAFAGDGYRNKYVVYYRYEKTADNTGVLHRGGTSALYKITKKIAGVPPLTMRNARFLRSAGRGMRKYCREKAVSVFVIINVFNERFCNLLRKLRKV